MTPQQQEEYNIIDLAVGQLATDLHQRRLQMAHGALAGLTAIVRRLDALTKAQTELEAPKAQADATPDATPIVRSA